MKCNTYSRCPHKIARGLNDLHFKSTITTVRKKHSSCQLCIVCENTQNELTISFLESPGLLILDEGHFPQSKDTNITKFTNLSTYQGKNKTMRSH